MGIHTIHPKHLMLTFQHLSLSLVRRKGQCHPNKSKSWLNHRAPEANPGAAIGIPHQLWTIHAEFDLGFVLNPLLFSHARFQFQEGARRNEPQREPHGGIHEWLRNQAKIR